MTTPDVDEYYTRADLLNVHEAWHALGGPITGLAFLFPVAEVAGVIHQIATTDALWKPTDANKSVDDGGDAAFRTLFPTGSEPYHMAVILWASIRALMRIADPKTLRAAITKHAKNWKP